MTGQELKELMETVLPDSVLQRAVDAAGFEQRERKRDALKFLRAMLASASSPAGGRQADIMRTYFENGAPRIARGSFYDWFGPPLEEVMRELADTALAYAASQPKDLPGALGCVDDWLIVDSTAVRLHDRLKAVYPGAGDYAALKLHKTLSVGHGTVVAYHWSPAREHDSPHLVLDESWRGKGLLVDLAYASLQRLRDCQRFGVTIVMRLKENWKPKVERIVRGDVSRTFVPGTELDVVLADDVLTLGNAIDADVTVGPERIPMRLCGVHVPERGYCFYLTNLSRSLGPRQVADIYRVRWEIELNNKLDKSSHRLDEIDARTPAAVHALIHATIIASVLLALSFIATTEPLPRQAPRHALSHHSIMASLLACLLRVPSALLTHSSSTGPRQMPSGNISPPSSSMLAKTPTGDASHPFSISSGAGRFCPLPVPVDPLNPRGLNRSGMAAGEWPHERMLRRQRLARPVLDALKAWLDEHAGKAPPKSLLGKAITYALNHWTALCRPLENGMLEIDNGDVERTMRGPAMGRKNWLFAGSDEGAERAAILCTLLESAARHELDLGLYLRDVMLKLASGWPQSRLDELLPHRWRELHATAAAQAESQAAQQA